METAAPAKRMGKFRASYLLAAESFELFRKDKEIVWFVVLNIVSVLLVAFLFVGVAIGLALTGVFEFPVEGEEFSLTAQLLGYGALLIFYLITSYITAFYGVALASVVSARLEGEDKGFKDGMKAAGERAGKIFGWSLLASTVGVILQAIADRLGWAGRLFSFLGNVAWSVATFFIVPVLARENENVKGSVKRSTEIFVKTWGETIIMNFSLSLFFLAVHLVLIVAAIGTGILLASNPLLVGVVVLGYVALFIFVAIMQSVLESVFKVVLYEYATRGAIPESFTPELVIGALTKKEPRTPQNG
jgi:hypothetical protein